MKPAVSRSIRVRAFATFLIALAAACAQSVSTGAVLAEQHAKSELDDATRVRLVAFETDLDAALVSINEPALLWVRGLLTRSDDAARARDLLAAHRAAPKEMLYLASLALTCHSYRGARPAACAESDWVAKWASADRDNAAPWLLLAQRSLRVRRSDRAIEDLAQGASSPRFDEYWNRATASAWKVIDTLLPGQGGLAAIVATGGQPLAATMTSLVLCRNGPMLQADGAREACTRLVEGPMARADSLSARTTAATIAASLSSDSDKAQAQARLDAISARDRACSDWLVGQANAGTKASPPAAAAGQGSVGTSSRVASWIGSLERLDEESACQQRAAP